MRLLYGQSSKADGSIPFPYLRSTQKQKQKKKLEITATRLDCQRVQRWVDFLQVVTEHPTLKTSNESIGL